MTMDMAAGDLLLSAGQPRVTQGLPRHLHCYKRLLFSHKQPPIGAIAERDGNNPLRIFPVACL